LLLVVAVGILSAGAQEAGDDFYRSQTIRIMVNATGGGFDASARSLARHLGRYIPGNPAVVVETMSGAGGLVAANYLYRVAKPDGLTLAHFSGDLLLGEVLGRPGSSSTPGDSSTLERARTSTSRARSHGPAVSRASTAGWPRGPR
jgi:tripartite-type tricarboxylate transporter receptor subunit TctC